MRQHREVGAPHRGPKVGIGGAAAPALAHRHVHAAETLLLKAVHIIGMRIARLATGAHPSRMQRVADGAVTGLQLAAIAAILVASLLPGFAAIAASCRPVT